MDIVPTKGIGSIRLGSTTKEIAAELGKPHHVTRLADTPGHPSNRRLLDYGDLSILTTPDDGVFAISIGRSFDGACLWGRKIFSLTGQEILEFLRNETGLEPACYGDPAEDSSIELAERGLIIYLSEGEIVEMELFKAGWHPPDRTEGP